MNRDYLISWIRGKRDEIEDLIRHLENNDIEDAAVKEYLVEIKNSLNRKIKKL